VAFRSSFFTGADPRLLLDDSNVTES